MPKSDQLKNNKHKPLYINRLKNIDSKLKAKKTTKMKNTFSFW